MHANFPILKGINMHANLLVVVDVASIVCQLRLCSLDLLLGGICGDVLGDQEVAGISPLDGNHSPGRTQTCQTSPTRV